VFGCTARARLAAPHLKKLDDSNKALVYFGVEEGSKAHILYDPESNRIVVSRDVVFEEENLWNWCSTLGGDILVEFVIENEARTGIFVDGNDEDA